MEKHCLNCVWFNKEKIHCDYEFSTSGSKPFYLDDDNNFIDDNEKLIQDINILQDFRCHKYYERPPKIINQMDLMQEYKNIVDKIQEHIKTELEKRYEDIEFNNDDFILDFTIKKCYRFELGLENGVLHICSCTETCDDYLDTFDELFKYIDDVISEEA